MHSLGAVCWEGLSGDCGLIEGVRSWKLVMDRAGSEPLWFVYGFASVAGRLCITALGLFKKNKK